MSQDQWWNRADDKLWNSKQDSRHQYLVKRINELHQQEEPKENLTYTLFEDGFLNFVAGKATKKAFGHLG